MIKQTIIQGNNIKMKDGHNFPPRVKAWWFIQIFTIASSPTQWHDRIRVGEKKQQLWEIELWYCYLKNSITILAIKTSKLQTHIFYDEIKVSLYASWCFKADIKLVLRNVYMWCVYKRWRIRSQGRKGEMPFLCDSIFIIGFQLRLISILVHYSQPFLTTAYYRCYCLYT